MKISMLALMASLLFAPLLGAPAAASDPASTVTIRTVAHVHSAYSGQKAPDMRATLELARRRGIEAVIFADDAIADFEYGLWPLRHLIKVSRHRTSILRAGPALYLEHIAALRAAFPDMIIIPGAEVAPHYYWSGDPLRGLTINNWNRHLSVAGMENAKDYEGLPLLGNARAAPFASWSLWPILLLAGAGTLWRFHRRRAALITGLLGTAFFLNNFPFRFFPFDQYGPPAGWRPYQALAAYADAKGALCFWNHPEAPNWQGSQKLGPRVWARTAVYPECLQAAPETDGFAALLEGDRTMTRPGGEWDQALQDYAQGRRAKAPWGFGELDYVGEGVRGLTITSVSMDVHASTRSAQALLVALRAGRFEAIATEGGMSLSLQKWRISSGGRSAGSGEILKSSGPVSIGISLAPVGAPAMTARVSLIRNGLVIFHDTVEIPFSREIPDDPGGEKKNFYRLDARFGANGALLSNPIFVFND